MGIYIATNIASSLALTTYTKNQISSQIPGYEDPLKPLTARKNAQDSLCPKAVQSCPNP